MKERRKFNERTEKFTPRDRKIVEEKQAKIHASLPERWTYYATPQEVITRTR